MRSAACNDCRVGNRRAEDLPARRAQSPSVSLVTSCGYLIAGEQWSTVLASVKPPVDRWCGVAALCVTRDCICCLSAGSSHSSDGPHPAKGRRLTWQSAILPV